MHTFSFFEGSSFNIRDFIFIFIKQYLDENSLKQCALSTDMDYKSTAVNWASYIREMFLEYVYKTYQTFKFDAEVEIGESLFGRKNKYNRGRPTGHKLRIFGIVERSSNLLVLYPVDNRDAATLIPIIQKHVRPGTIIYSDNWVAYFNLNNLGYEHFTVTHKTTFKQIYKNVDTGEIVHCNTNRIEGHGKYLRTISGKSIGQILSFLSSIYVK